MKLMGISPTPYTYIYSSTNIPLSPKSTMLSTNNLCSFILLYIRDKITLIYYTKQNMNNVLEEAVPTLELNVIEDSPLKYVRYKNNAF